MCRTHIHTATLDSNCNTHGSLLQCGRHASTLQHPATNCNSHCSLLQCVAEIHLNCRSCIKLQHTPLCVAVWQIHNHTATLYNKLQQTLQRLAGAHSCCSALQQTATHTTVCCSVQYAHTLQQTATHKVARCSVADTHSDCNTLQHKASHTAACCSVVQCVVDIHPKLTHTLACTC